MLLFVSPFFTNYIHGSCITAKQYGIKNESYWEHWVTLWEPDGNILGTIFENFPLPLPQTLKI